MIILFLNFLNIKWSMIGLNIILKTGLDWLVQLVQPSTGGIFGVVWSVGPFNSWISFEPLKPTVRPLNWTDYPFPSKPVNYWLTKILLGFRSHKAHSLSFQARLCKPNTSLVVSLSLCVFIPHLESICFQCGTGSLVLLKGNFAL